MGSESHNYRREAMARRGFPDAAERIGDLWRAGRKAEAEAAVPADYLEQTALVGPVSRIRRRREEGMVPSGFTGMIISAEQPDALELMATLAGSREQLV